MNLRISGLLAIAASALVSILGGAQCFAQNAYITNDATTVIVIDTATDTVVTRIPIVGVAGVYSFGVAVSQNGSRVDVTDLCSNSISVIDATTNTIVATIPGIINPQGIAATPDGNRVYATNFSAPGTIKAIDTVTNTVIDSIVVGLDPYGIAVTPDGQKVLVANQVSGGVSVIDTETNMVTATCPASCARSSASAW